MQQGLRSNSLTNNEVFMLYRIRSRMLDVKNNFRTIYSENMNCRLGCLSEENIEHLLSCKHLMKHFNKSKQEQMMKMSERQAFGNISKQKELTSAIIELLRVREEIEN